MKGSMRVKLTSRIFKGLIALKNKQIKLERERRRGYKETNDILAAYLALLVEKHGSARVPKILIREALGSYRAVVGAIGDDYVITVERCNEESKKAKDSGSAKTSDCAAATAYVGDGEN